MSSKYISPQEWKNRLNRGGKKEVQSEVPGNAFVEDGAILGNGVHIGFFCHIQSSAIIGDGAQIESGAVVKSGAVIGKRAIIGANATIEGGIKVGEYSRVEPNTYLKRDLPPHHNASACEIVVKELKTL